MLEPRDDLFTELRGGVHGFAALALEPADAVPRHAQLGSGSWAGRGSARASRALKCRPSYVTGSPLQVSRSTSSDSSKRSLRSSKSTPSAKNSDFRYPAAAPRMSRPFDRRSSDAADF